MGALGIKNTIKTTLPSKSTKQSNAKKPSSSKSSFVPSKLSRKPRQTVTQILSGSDEEVEEGESHVPVPDNSNEEESKKSKRLRKALPSGTLRWTILSLSCIGDAILKRKMWIKMWRLERSTEAATMCASLLRDFFESR